jgi:hypothetical protein
VSVDRELDELATLGHFLLCSFMGWEDLIASGCNMLHVNVNGRITCFDCLAPRGRLMMIYQSRSLILDKGSWSFLSLT